MGSTADDGPKPGGFGDPPPWSAAEAPAADTMGYAAAAQREGRDSPAWQPLSERLERFLRDAFRHENLRRQMEFEDFQQEVAAKLAHELPRVELRSRPEFWGYVRKLAEHTLIDLVRRADAEKRGAGQVIGQTRDPEFDPVGTAADAAAWSASVNERCNEILAREAECVASALPKAEQREIYLLRRQDGLSHAEIAARVGRAHANTVKLIYKRARDRVIECLREKLDGYEDELPPAAD